MVTHLTIPYSPNNKTTHWSQQLHFYKDLNKYTIMKHWMEIPGTESNDSLRVRLKAALIHLFSHPGTLSLFIFMANIGQEELVYLQVYIVTIWLNI